MKVKKLIKKLKKAKKEHGNLIVKAYDGSYAPEMTPVNDVTHDVETWGLKKGEEFIRLDVW